MKPLQRILSANASRICHQCRRTFSSTSSRAEDMIDSLSESINARPVSATTTISSTSRSASTPSSAPSSPLLRSIRNTLGRVQYASNPLGQKTKENEENIIEGVLAGINKKEAEDALGSQMARKWRAGDVYSLHDLGPREGAIWSRLRRRPKRDVFEMVGQDPIKHYKNMPLLSQFVSETGRIKHSSMTGLKAKNQRKLAKAIRRAIGSGLMPSVHRHPEVIATDLDIDKYRTPRYGSQ